MYVYLSVFVCVCVCLLCERATVAVLCRAYDGTLGPDLESLQYKSHLARWSALEQETLGNSIRTGGFSFVYKQLFRLQTALLKQYRWLCFCTLLQVLVKGGNMIKKRLIKPQNTAQRFIIPWDRILQFSHSALLNDSVLLPFICLSVSRSGPGGRRSKVAQMSFSLATPSRSWGVPRPYGIYTIVPLACSGFDLWPVLDVPRIASFWRWTREHPNQMPKLPQLDRFCHLAMSTRVHIDHLFAAQDLWLD